MLDLLFNPGFQSALFFGAYLLVMLKAIDLLASVGVDKNEFLSSWDLTPIERQTLERLIEDTTQTK